MPHHHAAPAVLALAWAAATAALAQTAQPAPSAAAGASAPAATAGDFPAGAEPLATDALRARLAGKVFHVQPAAGPAWRLQYNDRGYWYVNAGSFADDGQWRVEGSRVCSTAKRRNESCNEVRVLGDALLLKRDNGEVVRLEPR